MVTINSIFGDPRKKVATNAYRVPASKRRMSLWYVLWRNVKSISLTRGRACCMVVVERGTTHFFGWACWYPSQDTSCKANNNILFVRAVTISNQCQPNCYYRKYGWGSKRYEHSYSSRALHLALLYLIYIYIYVHKRAHGTPSACTAVYYSSRMTCGARYDKSSLHYFWLLLCKRMENISGSRPIPYTW